MSMVGLGNQGLETICAVMNLPKPINKNSWQEHMKEVADNVEFITRTGFCKSAREEAYLTGDKNSLAVSGDRSWRKQGFASLQDIVSLIGYRTGKVLDVAVKNLFCRECRYWQKKEGTAQFEQWKLDHVCDINHEGSAGKMEPDGLKEPFGRSIEKYGVKYSTYIGDGDTKTYNELLKAQPYAEFSVAKTECVGHVQKRFGTRLRKLVQQNKALMGRGMLTGKYIDQLTSYYGKAIRQNCHSVEAMRRAVKAIYCHESSTDEVHNHSFCPSGKDSWCKYKKAQATNQLQKFKHKPSRLPLWAWEQAKEVFKAMTEETLLQRCVGGYTQNSNESLNARIWKLAPKKTFGGLESLRIAVYLAVGLFNEGSAALESSMRQMGLESTANLRNFCLTMDEKRRERARKPDAERNQDSLDLDTENNEPVQGIAGIQEAQLSDDEEVSDDELYAGPNDKHYGPGMDI